MKIMGIDASHRNTGVVILTVLPASKRILDIVYADTLKTKKVEGVLNEYDQVESVITRLNTLKFQHSTYMSVCEIAHFGRSFGSSRSVGITWGISIATKSVAYTENQIRSMFPAYGGKGAKQRALEWFMHNNLHLAEKIGAMDDHQVDAACAAIYHNLKTTQY